MPRRIILMMTLMALLGLSALSPYADEPVVRLFVFYSQTCPHCEIVLEEVLPPLLEKYGAQLQVRYFDISVPENYQALLYLEKRYNLEAEGIPQVFLGKRRMIGGGAIRDNLDRLIVEALEAGGVDYLELDLIPVASPTPELLPTESVTPTPTATLPTEYTRLPPEGCKWCDRETYGDKPIVYMAYFYDAACRDCDRVSYDLNLLYSRYPNLYICSFALSKDATLSEALGEHFRVPIEKRLVAPSVFVGEDYLVTPNINMETLTALVGKYAASGTKPPWEMVAAEQATQSIVERFRSFTALTVIGAGLIAGLNPCAFASIIFFISYLAVTKRKGKEILIIGTAFTVGVFISHLLIGLGIFGFVKQLGFVRAFSRIIYMVTMVLCAVLALLSLYDYVQIRRGNKEGIALRLPKSLQARLHEVIRERSRGRGFARAAFMTGLLVSVFEFACTSQVYLPTIVFVTGVPELQAHAVAYLVLYNLLFVSPLVIIFSLTFSGATWRRFNRFLEANMATLKLLTAGLFALLAVWLGIYII